MDWASLKVSAYRRYLGMKSQRELIRSLSLLRSYNFVQTFDDRSIVVRTFLYALHNPWRSFLSCHDFHIKRRVVIMAVISVKGGVDVDDSLLF